MPRSSVATPAALIVNVPNRFFKPRITVELTADVQIGLDLGNLSLAKVGDKISAAGYYVTPGICEAGTIEVALANPLAPPGSRSAAPAPPPLPATPRGGRTARPSRSQSPPPERTPRPAGKRPRPMRPRKETLPPRTKPPRAIIRRQRANRRPSPMRCPRSTWCPRPRIPSPSQRKPRKNRPCRTTKRTCSTNSRNGLIVALPIGWPSYYRGWHIPKLGKGVVHAANTPFASSGTCHPSYRQVAR